MERIEEVLIAVNGKAATESATIGDGDGVGALVGEYVVPTGVAVQSPHFACEDTNEKSFIQTPVRL